MYNFMKKPSKGYISFCTYERTRLSENIKELLFITFYVSPEYLQFLIKKELIKPPRHKVHKVTLGI